MADIGGSCRGASRSLQQVVEFRAAQAPGRSGRPFGRPKPQKKTGRSFDRPVRDTVLQLALGGLELASGELAAALVLLELVAHLLAFLQLAHARAFDRRSVNEHVRAARVRLDEAVAFGGVEPLNRTGRQEKKTSRKISAPAERGRDRILERPTG